MPALQSYCLWRTADLQAAEDATATVFLEAWRKRQRLTLTTDTAVPLLLQPRPSFEMRVMDTPSLQRCA